MQYETIILELMTRIKKLEDEVNELKKTIIFPVVDNTPIEDNINNTYEDNIDNSVAYR